MLNSPKHLTWAFFTIAIALMAFVACTGQTNAESLSLEALGSQAEQQPQKESPEIQAAWSRFTARDVASAKRILDKVTKSNPDLLPSEMIMAQFYEAVRQPQGVLFWLEQAVQAHPDNPDTYVKLGQLDMQTGHQVEAWFLLKKADSLLETNTEIKPDRKKNLESIIQRQLAKLAMVQKKWKEATENLQKLLAEQPEDAEALQLLARVYFEEGKADEALQKLKAAKKVNEKVLTPQAIMAQWYENQDERDKATKAMQEALTTAPKDFETRLAAARWAFMTKNFDQAQKQAQDALKLDPSSADAMLLIGSIAIFQHDYATAEKYLEQAAKEEPMSFAASNNLILALCEQDNPAKLKRALDLAQRNTQLYPKQAEAFSTLGRVFYKSDRVAEAEQALNKTRSLGQAISPDTAYYIAVVLADTKRPEDAKKWLQEALKSKSLFAQRTEAEALLQRLSQ